MLRPFLAYVFDAIHNRLRGKGQLNERGNTFYAYNMFVEFLYCDGTLSVYNEVGQLILFVSDRYPFALKDGDPRLKTMYSRNSIHLYTNVFQIH